jgi:hypothetical protein
MVLLVSCESLPLEDLRPQHPVVTAVLEAGEQQSEVALFYLSDQPGERVAIEGATVRIRDAQGGAGATAVFDNGVYHMGNFQIVAGHSYQLEISREGEVYTAACEVPPALVLVNLSNSSAQIDTSTMGAPLLSVTWNELPTDKYSYALLLENVETNPVVIPFTQVTGGQFAALYQTPILNNTITLFDSDFNYYGQHRLSIFAIERGLEYLYFYNSSDLRGLLQTAPGNVRGAHGYFAGVSRLTVDLLIQP